MIKLKITQLGAFAVLEGKEQELPIGEVLTIPGDEVPGWLLGKGEVVGEVAEEAVAVTNPANVGAPADDKKKA